MTSNGEAVVLVVDDTPDNLSFMHAMLSGSYKVKVANNGEKALRIARSEAPPELILLDVAMPGMNGYEVCRQLKAEARTQDIPIIFLTALADQGSEEQGLQLGAVDYITKPINPSIVMARIKTHLDLKAARDHLRDRNLLLEQEVTLRTQEVRKSYQLNQQIVDCAQEGIIVHDRDLRYQVWNPFMERLTGVAARDVVGKAPVEVFPFVIHNGALEQVERALAGEATRGGEFHFDIPSTGRTGWTHNTAAPLRNDAGEIIGVIRTIRDITVHRSLEEQLRQSQKMEAIGQLASGVAHDFNNVLQVILGYGSMLTLDKGLNDKNREQVRQILSAADRAVQLTRGLLAFSRRQVMEPRVVDLNDVVRQVQKFLARVIGEDIRLCLSCHASRLPVNVDSGQIEMVLVNLGTNARDAMPGGGLISVETGIQELEVPCEHVHGMGEPGHYAWIAVSDTGTGMDQETRRKIFEPFFTTKEVGKGTGLGMAIVYGIVKQHGGFIHVYSEVGSGTTFRVYLPLVEAVEYAEGEKAMPAVPRGGHETILVAEDDFAVRKLMVTVLSNFGYQVIEAENGEEVVVQFIAHHDQVDLIVMDMIMPRKNGAEAYELIRQIEPGVKNLYLSGYTADFIQDRGALKEGVHVLLKPVQPMELLRKVRELLDG